MNWDSKMNYVLEYCEKLQSGEIVACKKIKKWYLNHILPVVKGEDPNYYFDEDEGERFIKFSKFCKQSKGDWYGKPTELMLFQKAKYQAIFGIYNRTTGLRRFKEIFDVRGRKNGKSTENAILGNYLTLEESGAEIYAAATVQSQARRVWEESQSMIELEPLLQKRLKFKVFPTPTIYSAKKSVYKVLSKNVKSFDGLNASGAIIDEVHELARAIYDILKQSMSARKQALMSMITTGGFVRGGLFDDMYDYSSKVIDGLIDDDTLFPLIYELDDIKEMEIEECWIKANPGIDVIKNREDLRYNVKRMKEDKNFANTVKIKDFNIIGVDNKSWLSFEEFNVEDSYTEEELRAFDNSVVLGGFDLSRTGDITAFTTLLFDKQKHRPIAITMYWVTANFLSKQREDSRSKVPWDAWIDRGLIRVSGTNLIDYHDIANYVIANFSQHGWMYEKINYDNYSAQYLIEELESLGYPKDYVLEGTPQGFKTLSIPMQTLQAHLKQKQICYQNNPVTKWMLSNVELVQDRNGNYMPKKADDNQSRKIDGVATILNCYVSLCANMDYYLS